MKALYKIFFFLVIQSIAVDAYSQETGGKEKSCEKLLKENNQLRDSCNVQQSRTKLLLSELESNKELTKSQLAAFKEENEKLREIMRNFVKQIDELNSLNLELERKLEACENK